MDAIAEVVTGADAANYGRSAKEPRTLTNPVNGFGPGTMCAVQVGEFELFQLVQLSLLIVRRKQVQAPDDRLHRLVWKSFASERRNADHSGVATAGDKDHSLRGI
jgi:hypothetical protein